MAVLWLIQCRVVKKDTDPKYLKQVKQWQQGRLNRLKAKDSWLSLAGLFWLTEGKNTFGSDTKNGLIIKEVTAPPVIGTFTLAGGTVSFKAKQGIAVFHGAIQITEMVLKDDSTGKATKLSHRSLNWHIINRGKKYAVRLKDGLHPRINKLKQIPVFAIDPKWKIKAKLQVYDSPKTIKTPTVLGTVNDSPSPGILVFKIQGKQYRLHPIGGEGELFIIFADKTNTKETYGGGRFLMVKKPDFEGKTFIDFNLAYNPPCVFSSWATCPLAPYENDLPVRVTAGEKMLKDFHY